MNPQQPYQQYPPQQPGWPEAGGQHSGGYPYPSGEYQQPAAQRYVPPLPAPAPKRRRIWPWALLAIVLVPVLVVVSCSALFVGGVTAVQDQRAGGTLPIGQTFTHRLQATQSPAGSPRLRCSTAFLADVRCSPR